MNQLVHDGEFNVLQHLVERQLVIRRIENANYSRLLFGVPMNVTERLGLQFGSPRNDQRDIPVLEVEALLPDGETLDGIMFGQHRAFPRSFRQGGRQRRLCTRVACENDQENQG